MIGGSVIEKALRRDRIVVVFCLLFVVVLSWAYLLSGAGMMQAMGDMMMPMSTGPWTLSSTLLVLVMWAVMMAARQTYQSAGGKWRAGPRSHWARRTKSRHQECPHDL